jgi:signal transduction histidine kinase
MVWVELICRDGYIYLSVADNGQGDPPVSHSLSNLIRERHYGIVGMYEWASSVQGILNIGRREEGGTRVVFEMPLVTAELLEPIGLDAGESYES